jgi:hypothetical protein
MEKLISSLIWRPTAASEGHVSHPNNGVVRIECKFAQPLPEPITCLLYLE